MIVIYYQLLKPAIIVDILPAHTYRGATIFVIYIGKKIQMRMTMNLWILISYVISWGIVIDNALICH